MPEQPAVPDRKKPEPDDTKNKKTVPDPTDDRPQREDEYLSKFLQDPSPEGSKPGAGEKDKGK
jgi:hypothetical protein